jgi:LacI family transcriptional regulator
VPEDIALVGADNDVLACELLSPPLSSVMIPWKELGRSAATLVRLALSSQSIAGKRVVVSAIDVAVRRSSDVLAVDGWRLPGRACLRLLIGVASAVPRS